MTIEQLEQNLAAAQQRLQQMWASGNLESGVYEALSQAQRDLAAAQGQEYANELDFGIFPEAAVSGPVLFQDDYHTFLVFNAMRPTPNGRREPVGIAIVEIQGCLVTQFGHPNDEALPGHPLYNRGLGAYDIYEVMNSSWIEKHIQINLVHFPDYRQWDVRHFIFAFHDSTFECIARDIKLEVEPFSPQFQKIYDFVLAWEDATGTG